MKSLVKINLKHQGSSPSLASHKMALVETVKGCDCEISAEDQSASAGVSLLFMFHSLTLKVQSCLFHNALSYKLQVSLLINKVDLDKSTGKLSTTKFSSCQ